MCAASSLARTRRASLIIPQQGFTVPLPACLDLSVSYFYVFVSHDRSINWWCMCRSIDKFDLSWVHVCYHYYFLCDRMMNFFPLISVLVPHINVDPCLYCTSESEIKFGLCICLLCVAAPLYLLIISIINKNCTFLDGVGSKQYFGVSSFCTIYMWKWNKVCPMYLLIMCPSFLFTHHFNYK
jgi:hypothetical protein